MHQEVRDYIQKIRGTLPEYFKDKRVLEMGSLDWNGTPREYFENCEYIGVDISGGHGVDIICDSSKFDGGPFDVIITTEMLEHDKNWKESLLNAKRLLKENGLLIVTAANVNREPHCLEIGFYRNISKQDILSIFPDAKIEEDENKQDVRFIWKKHS
jgi:SAM-dependent methyltransferase